MFVCCAGVLVPALTHGLVLDWNAVDWAGGATSQTFSNVQGSDIDVSISLVITGAVWANWSGQAQPDDNPRLAGDGGTPYHAQGEGVNSSGQTSQESLHLHMQSGLNNFRGYVDVVISFSRAVTGVSFQLFDVDSGSTFEDVIGDIRGTLNATQVAPAAVSYEPRGTNYGIEAGTRNGSPIYRGTYWSPDAPDAVLGLAWNTQVVDTVSFRYYAGDRTPSNPSTQGISISDIRFFAAVPEAGTMAGGALLLAGLGVLEWRRRRASVIV
jgi:hypothetical protein